MMSRILWIFALLMIVGAHKHDDKWKRNMKAFVDEMTRHMSQSLQKSFGLYYEDFRDGSYPHSATASPVVHTEGTPVDHKPTKKPLESSTKSYPSESSSTSDSIQIGSLKGIPGHNFPDYTEIPLTSFTCSDKGYVPGFYADLETGCQVFHVCWPHRRESFLCPVGTTFNQALLACDYWYSTNCSLAPHYYDVNGFSMKSESSETKDDTSSMIDVLLGTRKESSTDNSYKTVASESDSDMSFVAQFLPVKAKVTIYPGTEDTLSKIVATASVGAGKKYDRERKDTSDPKKPEDKPKETKLKFISESKVPIEPHKSEPSVIIRTINVEEATKYFMDRADQMIQNFINDLKRGPCPKESGEKEQTEKRPLTQLNQKFVVKPLSIPEKTDTPSRPSKRAVLDSSVPVSEDLVPDSSKKQTEARPTRPKLNVLPMTKKALVDNYVRFMKTRRRA